MLNTLNTSITLYAIDANGVALLGFFRADTDNKSKSNHFTILKASGDLSFDKWSLVQYFPSLHRAATDDLAPFSQDYSFTVRSIRLIEFLTFLQSITMFHFEQLRDISAIDHAKYNQRFEVVYQLLSILNAKRIRLTVFISEGGSLISATSLYPSAGWYERETWDRFGIFFSNHSDLRRILTDYGFKGHPLRKDFPVTGFVEVRYSADTKSIVYEKVSLAQASRETVS